VSKTQNNYINLYHLPPVENRLPIEQAPSDREWMDQTAGGYAYRCLPMSYANRHGWCFRLEQDVEVIWDGGTGAESTQIIRGRDQNGFRVADNGTGNGIVTFHLNAIPRTSKDWNLWIMGAPNLVIPGASPLSGVVESDWAFGSPTSNWKLTTPNTSITFKKGDPVFFFVPVHKTELESFEISNFSIRDDEDINKHFEDHCRWRSESDAAGKGVNGKMYRKGIRADGTKPDFPHNHKTKLSLHEPNTPSSNPDKS
jgi:hypothetical protein